MTFQPPDWWYKPWHGEWSAEAETLADERITKAARGELAAEVARRKEQD